MYLISAFFCILIICWSKMFFANPSTHPVQGLIASGGTTPIKCYPQAALNATPTISPWVPQWANVVWHWGMHLTAGSITTGSFNIDYAPSGGSQTCSVSAGTVVPTSVRWYGGVGGANQTALKVQGPEVDCLATTVATISKTITFGGWINQGTAGSISGYGSVFYGLNDTDGTPGWDLEDQPGSTEIYLRLDTSAGANQFCSTGTVGGGPLAGGWHQVFYTITGTTGGTATTKVYQDGTLKSTCSLLMGNGFAYGGASPKQIGFNNAKPNNTSETYYAEWTIWNVALTAAEIKTLYDYQNCFRLK
jgi:hypothetical protein